MRSLVDALGDAGGKAMKMLKGVDDLGPNKMTPQDASAYIEYGKKYHAEHGSMKGHMKVNYLGDEFSLKKNKDGPDGEVNLKTRNKKVKDKEAATRKYNEQKGFDAIQDEQNRLGRPQEETDEIISRAKKGNARQARDIKFANRATKDPKKKQTVGHIRAVGRKGSLDVPENRMKENARYNYATQDKADAPDLNIRMAGAPDNVTTYIKQLQVSNEFPQLNLSKLPNHIRRKILAASGEDEIDDILTAYEKSLSKRPRRRKKA